MENNDLNKLGNNIEATRELVSDLKEGNVDILVALDQICVCLRGFHNYLINQDNARNE